MSSSHLYPLIAFSGPEQAEIIEPVFTWENTICTFVKHLAYTLDHGLLNIFSK
jgi:hypothetical protein